MADKIGIGSDCGSGGAKGDMGVVPRSKFLATPPELWACCRRQEHELLHAVASKLCQFSGILFQFDVGATRLITSAGRLVYICMHRPVK